MFSSRVASFVSNIFARKRRYIPIKEEEEGKERKRERRKKKWVDVYA